jgi:hypothetical protein
MGSLVAAHLVRNDPPAELLARLPPSMGWRLYREPVTAAFLIEVFASSAKPPPRWPFGNLPRIPELALELPEPLAPLNDLYDVLLQQQRAGSFRRRYVNLNLLLSRALDMQVFSFASDDDGTDLACCSVAGQLHRLRFETDGLEIVWIDGRGVIRPLRFDDDSEVADADLQELKARLPRFDVLATVEGSTLLHRIAAEECCDFLRTDTPILGLGGEDGFDSISPAITELRRSP